MFDQYSFISYLQELKRKFHKLILFLDRAQNSSSNLIGYIYQSGYNKFNLCNLHDPRGQAVRGKDEAVIQQMKHML
jgi:hypothetical protein